jgi:hypothetical protein
MPKYFSKKKYRVKKFNKKTRKNKKGGWLFDQNIKIAGIDMSKQTGKKQYNWKTGKWDNVECYGVGPFKACKIKKNE